MGCSASGPPTLEEDGEPSRATYWRMPAASRRLRVERARIVWLAIQGVRAPAIAREGWHLHLGTARFWLQRFNMKGVGGLEDEPRPGPAPTFTHPSRWAP